MGIKKSHHLVALIKRRLNVLIGCPLKPTLHIITHLLGKSLRKVFDFSSIFLRFLFANPNSLSNGLFFLLLYSILGKMCCCSLAFLFHRWCGLFYLGSTSGSLSVVRPWWGILRPAWSLVVCFAYPEAPLPDHDSHHFLCQRIGWPWLMAPLVWSFVNWWFLCASVIWGIALMPSLFLYAIFDPVSSIPHPLSIHAAYSLILRPYPMRSKKKTKLALWACLVVESPIFI